MTNSEIFELMTRFDAGIATNLKVSRGDFSIELSRGVGPVGACVSPLAVPALPTAPAPAEVGTFLTAALVGTYYAVPSPDAPPFVSVGQRVEKGQTVCLMEAMKMMSEVTAPCDCVVEELLQENGALVSFGAPLLRYKER